MRKSMKIDPDKHHRRSIRLPQHDYSSPGAYFITICSYRRELMFGNEIEGEIELNPFGMIALEEWNNCGKLKSFVHLDAFVVMPNHVHGIVVFADSVGAIHESPLQMTASQRRNMGLSKWIGRFKMQSSKKINQLRGLSGNSGGTGPEMPDQLIVKFFRNLYLL